MPLLRNSDGGLIRDPAGPLVRKDDPTMAFAIAMSNGALLMNNGAVLGGDSPGAMLASSVTGRRLASATTGEKLARAAAPVAPETPPVRVWFFPVKDAGGNPVAGAGARADLYGDGVLTFCVATRRRVIHYAESAPGYDLAARPPLTCRLTGKALRVEFDLSQPSPLSAAEFDAIVGAGPGGKGHAEPGSGKALAAQGSGKIAAGGR